MGKLTSRLILFHRSEDRVSERGYILLKVTQLVRLAMPQIMDVQLSWTIKAIYRLFYLL